MDRPPQLGRILALGVDPNSWYATRCSELIDKPESLEMILDAGLDPSCCLAAAAKAGDWEQVASLLERHPTDLERGITGHPSQPTVLAYAIEADQEALVETLVTLGADLHRNFGGSSYLHRVAKTGNLHLARLLVEAGADRTIRDSFHRKASRVARRSGYPEVARVIRRGPGRE